METGGSNIQFSLNPDNGEMLAIEMNPRVSRSSALASKATGFPIAKIAAKLAVGYTLDEISNDITRYTPACFEPTIDYCVVKIPRFNFEKFPDTDPTLTIHMKSVGEVMAIGRTFKESIGKAIRSLESGRCGFESLWPSGSEKWSIEQRSEFLRGKINDAKPGQALAHRRCHEAWNERGRHIPMDAHRPLVPLQHKAGNGYGRQATAEQWTCGRDRASTRIITRPG